MPTVNLTGSNQLIATAAPILRYRGFSVRETSGTTTALIKIYDGTSASGTILEEISLTASQSAREYYPPEGVFTASVGIYAAVTGSVEGSVRYD